MPGSRRTGPALRRREATVADDALLALSPEQQAEVAEIQALANLVLKLLGSTSMTNPKMLLAVLTVVLANIATWVPNATPATDKEMLDILMANVHATLANARLDAGPPARSA